MGQRKPGFSEPDRTAEDVQPARGSLQFGPCLGIQPGGSERFRTVHSCLWVGFRVETSGLCFGEQPQRARHVTAAERRVTAVVPASCRPRGISFRHKQVLGREKIGLGIVEFVEVETGRTSADQRVSDPVPVIVPVQAAQGLGQVRRGFLIATALVVQKSVQALRSGRVGPIEVRDAGVEVFPAGATGTSLKLDPRHRQPELRFALTQLRAPGRGQSQPRVATSFRDLTALDKGQARDMPCEHACFGVTIVH